jgi:hypothetical protein
MISGDEALGGISSITHDAVRVLAKTLFKELKRMGYGRSEIVSFASELLDLVTEEMKSSSGRTSKQHTAS